MAFQSLGDSALDYELCRYGASKLLFRGPRRRLDGDYCAVLGGTETYGRFVERPYPALIEAATGLRVVNFGCQNAGVDVYLHDPEVIENCRRARLTVVQILGAANMSNRYYSVHPRRNDRFLRASSLMKTIFREVDFTEFHFTRHMLSSLADSAPEKFEVVVEELKAAWVARMKLLLGKLDGPVVLLWMADHPPAGPEDPVLLDREPVMVDREMIAAVRGPKVEYLEVVASAEARARGTEGMVLTDFDAAAAAELPGPATHEEVAQALAPLLRSGMAPKPLFRRGQAG